MLRNLGPLLLHYQYLQFHIVQHDYSFKVQVVQNMQQK